MTHTWFILLLVEKNSNRSYFTAGYIDQKIVDREMRQELLKFILLEHLIFPIRPFC